MIIDFSFQEKPKFHLYSKPFSWKQKLPILPVIRAQEEAYEVRKNAPNSISLIAGVYGENSDQVIISELPLFFTELKSGENPE